MREEEKKRKSQKSGIKRLLSKRWALPAIYLACAAILLAAVLYFQDSDNNVADPGDSRFNMNQAGGTDEREAVEVDSKQEKFSWPVENSEKVVIKKEFYDLKSDKAAQENALIKYDNKFELSRGIDVAMENGKSFDVLAAVSGTVTKVQEDALLGNVIEIDHGKGIMTRYQSVTDFAVKSGDTVAKGQPIAKAGQSLLNQDAGIHVHFEIRKDSIAVNPIEYFEKSVSALVEAELVNAEAAEEVNADAEEGIEEISEEDPSSEETTDQDGTSDEEEVKEESTEDTTTEKENTN